MACIFHMWNQLTYFGWSGQGMKAKQFLPPEGGGGGNGDVVDWQRLCWYYKALGQKIPTSDNHTQEAWKLMSLSSLKDSLMTFNALNDLKERIVNIDQLLKGKSMLGQRVCIM